MKTKVLETIYENGKPVETRETLVDTKEIQEMFYMPQPLRGLWKDFKQQEERIKDDKNR
jgi:hypothetical protein